MSREYIQVRAGSCCGDYLPLTVSFRWFWLLRDVPCFVPNRRNMCPVMSSRSSFSP